MRKRMSSNLKMSPAAYLACAIAWFAIAAYILISGGELRSTALWLILGVCFLFLAVDSKKNPDKYEKK